MATGILIGGFLIAAIIIFTVIWQIRTHNFRPTQDKGIQLNRLNASLEPTGFAYEPRGDVFYSTMDCWQREVGYCRLYDEGAPIFCMVMDCEPVGFTYAGKRWLIELWKGQYGITTGGEVGIYNTSRPDLDTEWVKGTFFECASDAERMPISIVLRKKGRVVLKRKSLHWWLAAFKLGEFSHPESLTMDVKIKFPNRQMCAAFVGSLQSIGYRKPEYAVRITTVIIHYTRPKTVQPPSQDNIHSDIVQQINKNNCDLFIRATEKYPDSLDKLEYIQTAMPELYHFLLESLYAKGFFKAFDLIRDALREQLVENNPPQGGRHSCDAEEKMEGIKHAVGCKALR